MVTRGLPESVPADVAAWWLAAGTRHLELIAAAPKGPLYVETVAVPMELRGSEYRSRRRAAEAPGSMRRARALERLGPLRPLQGRGRSGRSLGDAVAERLPDSQGRSRSLGPRQCLGSGRWRHSTQLVARLQPARLLPLRLSLPRISSTVARRSGRIPYPPSEARHQASRSMRSDGHSSSERSSNPASVGTSGPRSRLSVRGTIVLGLAMGWTTNDPADVLAAAVSAAPCMRPAVTTVNATPLPSPARQTPIGGSRLRCSGPALPGRGGGI